MYRILYAQRIGRTKPYQKSISVRMISLRKVTIGYNINSKKGLYVHNLTTYRTANFVSTSLFRAMSLFFTTFLKTQP